MNIEERRTILQESFELMKKGKRREDVFDYLISKGLEKSDVSQILSGSEERLKRFANIKAAETDLSLPIAFIFFGCVLLYAGKFLLFHREGYVNISEISIIAVGAGIVLIPVGIVTFILKLKNRFSKKYDL